MLKPRVLKEEKFDRRKINHKNTKKVMMNMLKMKAEDKKASRSMFFDKVVGNVNESYKKDFSFLSKPRSYKTNTFRPISEQTLWDDELRQIIEELESDLG